MVPWALEKLGEMLRDFQKMLLRFSKNALDLEEVAPIHSTKKDAIATLPNIFCQGHKHSSIYRNI